MSIGSILSGLVIGPLKLLFETIFAVANRWVSPGWSIVVLSLAVNLLVLPLYRRADAIQAEEREREKKLSRGTDHIKKTFTGNERFMILQAYYRENHYSPVFSLRSAVPLLLQIPFFIAAYQFLSGLELIRGADFGPIRDLGLPDRLLRLGGTEIHALPILMTAVNLISGALYSKDEPLRSKIQLTGMALIFLALLYSSPAGLTLYWTLNNLFSLVKNLLARFGRPRKKAGERRLPGVLRRKANPALFFAAAGFIALLTGLLIPSAVLVSSPSEFIDPDAGLNPVWYAVNALVLSAGIFVLWTGIYYALAGNAVKKVLEWGIWLAAGLMLLNYMAFPTGGGSLSNLLRFEEVPVFSARRKLLNAGALTALAVIMSLLYLRRENLTRLMCLTAAAVTAVMGGMNLVNTQRGVAEALPLLERSRSQQAEIQLSATGKNVVVIMLDRAVGAFFPVILAEKPELEASFDGFVFYPNTLSHGPYTNFGAPGVFGGYEYTPAEMNRRDTEPLQEKHNEALLLMPALFSEAGYTVTVCDPPYAGNYQMTPDLSLYDDLPNTKAYVTEGAFNEEDTQRSRQLRMRSFFCYSLCETAPLAFYGSLYNLGRYNAPIDERSETLFQTVYSQHASEGYFYGFMDTYSVLKNLSQITKVTDQPAGTLLLMVNRTTHEPMLLSEPDYEPAAYVDNTEYDLAHENRFLAGDLPLKMTTGFQMSHYHANMAAMIQIARWLDGLKALGVYDQTRIILVADHGRNLEMLEGTSLDEDDDVLGYNPLLLVKDFDSRGEVRTDRSFMTNADTPGLAMAGIIENPVNPFTGNTIQREAGEAPQQVTTSHQHRVAENRGNTFLPGEWYAVREDIFNMDNWQYLGEQ